MKKISQKIWSQILSTILLVALMLPVFVMPSAGWAGTPLCNQVTVYLNGKPVVSPNESYQSITGNFSPSSVLCGYVVYLPLEILIECGISVDFGSDNSTVIIDSVNLQDPVFRRERKQDTSKVTLGNTFLANSANIVVDGTIIAQAGKQFTSNGEIYPSSFFNGESIYLPVSSILRVFGIYARWESQLSSLYLNDYAPTVQIKNNIGLNNFVKYRNYTPGQFTDVAPSKWYADKIKAAYEYGLVSGTSQTSFQPTRNITIAEAITLASQLHNTYYSNEYTFQGNGIWYQPYIDYALSNHIITQYYLNYEIPISRGEFALIMSNAFPDVALAQINTIQDKAIPDIAAGSSYYNAVYRLYRAGVISGVDAVGTFNPNAQITRAEAATILGNMVDINLRKTFTLATPTAPVQPIPPVEPTQPVTPSQPIQQVSPLGASIIDSTHGYFSKTSIGLVRVCWQAINQSGKTINSYTVKLYFYDSTGNLVRDDIYGDTIYSIKVTRGPVVPGERVALFDNIGFYSTCSKVTIGEIDLEYSDGTSESFWYGCDLPSWGEFIKLHPNLLY